jgi:poly(3-hydroxybutyrate) depolymerase
MMAYRAACELRVPVAAIAVVAGNMADEHGIVGGVGCRPSGRVSVLAVSWPADLLALPSLLAWVVLITELSGTRDRPAALRLLALALIINVTLGIAGAALLTFVP